MRAAVMAPVALFHVGGVRGRIREAGYAWRSLQRSERGSRRPCSSSPWRPGRRV